MLKYFSDKVVIYIFNISIILIPIVQGMDSYPVNKYMYIFIYNIFQIKLTELEKLEAKLKAKETKED